MANERARDLRRTMTPAEIRLWLALRQLRPQSLHARRQVPRAGYILDFACLPAKIGIEVDGEQHGLDPHLERDRRRDASLEALGFRTLRFWNHEVLQNCDGVVETITIMRASGSRLRRPDRAPHPALRATLPVPGRN